MGDSEQCRRIPPVERDDISWTRTGEELRHWFPVAGRSARSRSPVGAPGTAAGHLQCDRVGVQRRRTAGADRRERGDGVLLPSHLAPVETAPRAGADISDSGPPIVEYKFSWRGIGRFAGRRRSVSGVTLTAQHDVLLSRLTVISSRNSFMPLRATDGDIVQSFENVKLTATDPYFIPLEIKLEHPSWVGCFVPDGAVDFRDPPPGNRRSR